MYKTDSGVVSSSEEPVLYRFQLGSVVLTLGVIRLQIKYRDTFNVESYIERHATGDWGQLSEDEKTKNECSLLVGGNLYSTYEPEGCDGAKIWIITEPLVRTTTILNPLEY